MEEFVKTFHIDWKLMIAQIINFGLVFLIFYFLTAKPLSKLVKERTEEINTGLVNAKTNEELLKATKTEYESALQKARLEADAIFNESKKEVQKKREEMLENAKKEVANMIDAGKKTLEQEKIKMVSDAKNELASLAILAAEKIMQDKK